MTRPVPAITQLPVDLRESFDRLVADATGPFGPTPLARLAAYHLPVFKELRRRGGSWAQIANLLHERGITGPGGAIGAATLRATVSRAGVQAAAAPAPAPDETRRSVTKRNGTQRDVAQQSNPQPHVTEQDTSQRDGTTANEARRSETLRDEARAHRSAPVGGANNLARRAGLIDKPWNS